MASLTQKQTLIAVCMGIIVGLLSAFLFGVQPESLAMLRSAERLPGARLGVFLLLNALFGAVYPMFWGRSTQRSYAAHVMTGSVYGLLWWILFALIGLPLILGQEAQWHVQEAANHFPSLIVYLFQGIGVSLGIPFLWRWLHLSATVHEAEPASSIRHRIVVLGGGFAGVTTAQRLEHLFRNDEGVEIVLVSDTNYLLFTPMLSEVVGGSVEPQHITTPLRSFFRRTRVVRAQVQRIELEQRIVHLVSGATPQPSPLSYNHLILAVGAVPHFFGNPSIERHAFTFKSLEDAIHLRNHMLERLEIADATPDPEQRRQMLTFVVAGGGYAGAELIGALNDFVRSALFFYPSIAPDEVRLFLVHSRERILPELSPELAAFAQRKLEERGVVVKLNTRVTAAAPGYVLLDDGEKIPTQTLVWTAGNQASPLLASLNLKLDRRGRVQTDSTLAVPGYVGLWAAGDCAAMPNRATGETAPPTAQHATRAATILAHNIYASIHSKPLKAFAHRGVGTLAVLGHQTACAELYGVRFAGMLAWWLWRAVYLGKLPTWQKKIRVALDWLVDLFFPRDIVQTESVSAGKPVGTDQTAPDSRASTMSTGSFEPQEEEAR